MLRLLKSLKRASNEWLMLLHKRFTGYHRNVSPTVVSTDISLHPCQFWAGARYDMNRDAYEIKEKVFNH